MEDDYYSISAILAENQRIQCTFKQNIEGLGYLDGSAAKDIKQDSKLQLPFWLAPVLLYSDYADFNIPHPYTQKIRNALNAEPRSVRLSVLVGTGGPWYGYGKRIVQLLDEVQAKELSDVLTEAFRQRLMTVMDQAQQFAAGGTHGVSAGGGSRAGDPGEQFREGLDGTERERSLLPHFCHTDSGLTFTTSVRHRTGERASDEALHYVLGR